MSMIETFAEDAITCPTCNSLTVFKAFTTNIIVCSICNSAMQRMQGGHARVLSLEVAKKDISRGVLQIGTKGVYNSEEFEIIGCLHSEFGEYRSRRWTILYRTGITGLLVETLGFYAIHEKVVSDFPSKLPTVKHTNVGTDKVEILRGRQFTIFEKATCEKIRLEGETYLFDTVNGFRKTELGELNGDRIELLERHDRQFELSSIRYVGLHELSLTGLDPTENVRELPCGNCGKPVTVRLPQNSLQCVCSNCNGWNEVVMCRELKFNKKNFEYFVPDLPIGCKGNISGLEYMVTGATVKKEAGSADIFWREYTLFDPLTGYAFLAEYNGHWTYLKEVKLNCPWPQFITEMYFDGESFSLFNDYSFTVRSAAGEFFTSLNTTKIVAREYISPPEMFAVENNNDKEITWFKASHIPNTEVYEGFGLIGSSMPYQSGVGPLQPMKFYMNLGLLLRMCGIILLIFFATQIFFEFTASRRVLYEAAFNIPDSVLSKGITTPSFELKPSSSNLQFLLNAPVDNSWFEVSATLVNDQTGTEYSFEKGVEYYEGYSEGEHWTEGSKNAEEMLSSIPGGRYHLNLFPASATGTYSQQFYVTLINDVPMWQNFFISVLILAIYPLVIWWRTQSFEKKRWNNSAYNPYSKNDE